MKAALVLVVTAVSISPAVRGQESLPSITLEEALERAARLDPNYVAASRQIADAAWARRAAITAFIVPSISSQLSITTYSNQTLNIGTGEPASTIATAQISGRLNLFAGMSKFHELTRTAAELEGARAGELEARFATALLTESDYYDVVAQRELAEVARERVRRANEQLGVARARVLAGSAVRTDSLQLLLELTEAQLALLGQEAQLKVARYQLARRVGAPGPVDAEFRDTLPGEALPLSEEQAIREAIEASPQATAARAAERASEALVRSTTGSYLPSVDLFGQVSAFDDKLFPSAITRSSIGVSVSLPIWDDGQRELTLSRAKTARDISRALRNDLELALRRDVVQAYEAYETARAAAVLAEQAVTVAQENLRVQTERYRAGATTIIDLITAQVNLSAAEAGLVQANYGTRLALSGLEAILGRRLF